MRTERRTRIELVRKILLIAFTAMAGITAAQTASLRGRVLDESGAVIPGAQVRASRTGALPRGATTDGQGMYLIGGLQAGGYAVTASAPQLALPSPVNVTIRAGANTLDLELRVKAAALQVTVDSNAPAALSTDASSNASATVLTGSDLEALSDDPQDLADDLALLAGPSAGPGGGSIYIDGFSGGQLPPKQSIREIRINSNPFSPEYDRLGLGRVEIFTKPGSDRLHASLGYNLGTARWNSRNPYAAGKSPFLLQETENTISGPVGRRTSFTFDF